MENKIPEKPAENARDEFLYPGSAPRREPAGKVTYVEYVGEIADHPNYEAALAAAKA